jgi:hypothetical protein
MTIRNRDFSLTPTKPTKTLKTEHIRPDLIEINYYGRVTMPEPFSEITIC